MKTAIVISDSHGNLRAIRKLYEIMEESDYVFHLGDYRRDIAEFEERFPEKVYSVYGNCDGYSGEGEVTIEGVKVFYTHGHDYGVKQSLYGLYSHAKAIGADVVLYGHTHIKAVDTKDNIKFVNPGTLKEYSPCKLSYAYIVFDKGKAYETLVDLY